MLAGLARDGGLYVPESWPQLAPGRDRGAGRAALRGGGVPGDAALRRRRLRRRRVPRDPRPRLCRLRPRRAGAAGADRGERLAARAVPRADARVQGRGDAADRPAVRGEPEAVGAAADHRRRDQRRHRLGGDRGVPRPGGRRGLHPLPRRPGLGGAAPADDDAARGERARAGDRRRLRRRAGAGEGPVQRPRLPRRGRARRGQLDQLGAGAGADGLLFHRRGGARRAAPAGQLRGADRQLRRRLRRLRGEAHGAADRAAGDRHQPERHPAPHARDRRAPARRRGALDQPVDGHPGQLELRAAALRALRPRGRRRWRR